MISFRKHLGVVSALASALVALTGCTENPNSNQHAGGVTDIGNSIAGVVVDGSGKAVPSARVVAYYDSWDQSDVKDSVVVQADAEGKYELNVEKNANIVLFASSGDECGLAATENADKTSRKIAIGKRRIYTSHIAGRLTGEMRVVGVTGDSAVTTLDADGYFIFYNMPPGDITLAYSDSSAQESNVKSRVEFTTTGDQNIMVLPELTILDNDPAWLTVMDLRYYVGEGYAGMLVRNPVSDYWTPVTELPQTDTTSSRGVSVAVPQIDDKLTGFLFPIKVNTKDFASSVNLRNIVVVNSETYELLASEIEYWNDEEALIWVRIAGADSDVTTLNFEVLEDAQLASNLIPFTLGQKYDAVLSRIHFNGDEKTLTEAEGLLGKGAILDEDQFISIDSADLTWGNFTLSMWAKWNGDAGRPQVLASERGDSTYKFQWILEDGKFALKKGAPSSAEVFEFDAAPQLQDGEWVHLVLTYDVTNSLWSMYVNGEQLGKSIKFSPAYTGPSMVAVRVGGSGHANDAWAGALDEIRVESLVRSSQWIKAVYETQKTASK